jgi:hypothetical protein
MSTRKTSIKDKSRSDSKAEVPALPVHDIKGVVVFPMSKELQAILGKESFEATCDDLRSRDFKLICRSPEAVVYVTLSPIVVPMDLVLSQTPPTPEALAAARRKAVRKSSTSKS